MDTTLFDAVEAGVYRRAPSLQSRSAQVRPLVWAALVRLDPGAFAPQLRILRLLSRGGGKTSKQSMETFGQALVLLGFIWKGGIGAARIRSGSQIQKALTAYTGCSHVGGYSGVKNPVELWFESEAEAEKGRQALSARVEQVSSAGPKQPEMERLYVHRIGAPHKDTRARWFTGKTPDDRWIVETEYWWLGVPAWTVTDFSGESHTVISPVDDRGRVLSTGEISATALWVWLYQQGVQKRAEEFLAHVGEEAIARSERPVRDLTGTGTCQGCFGNVKLTNGQTIFRHGWFVEGEYINGRWQPLQHHAACPGFGKLPFELSKDFTEQYFPKVQARLTKTESFILDQEAQVKELEGLIENQPHQVHQVYEGRLLLARANLASAKNARSRDKAWLQEAEKRLRNWTARPEALK